MPGWLSFKPSSFSTQSHVILQAYCHLIIPVTHSRPLCYSYLKLANPYHSLWPSAQTLWIFLNLYSCVPSNANSLLCYEISNSIISFWHKKKVTFKFRGGIDASVIQCVEYVKLSQYATWWWNSATMCSQLLLGILYFLSLFWVSNMSLVLYLHAIEWKEGRREERKG